MERQTPNTPAIASASRRRVAFSKCPYTLLVTSSDECPRCFESQKIGRFVLVRDPSDRVPQLTILPGRSFLSRRPSGAETALPN
jgi:hypothetical protein